MIWYTLVPVSLVQAPRSVLRGCRIVWKTLVTVLHFERTCEKLKKGKSWNFAAAIGWPIEGDSKHEMSILGSWGGWLAESVVVGGVTRSRGRGNNGGLTFAWESDTSGGICKAVCNERKNLSGVSGFSEFCEGSREKGGKLLIVYWNGKSVKCIFHNIKELTNNALLNSEKMESCSLPHCFSLVKTMRNDKCYVKRVFCGCLQFRLKRFYSIRKSFITFHKDIYPLPLLSRISRVHMYINNYFSELTRGFKTVAGDYFLLYFSCKS